MRNGELGCFDWSTDKHTGNKQMDRQSFQLVYRCVLHKVCVYRLYYTFRERSKFRHIVMDLNWPLFLAILSQCRFWLAGYVGRQVALVHIYWRCVAPLYGGGDFRLRSILDFPFWRQTTLGARVGSRASEMELVS